MQYVPAAVFENPQAGKADAQDHRFVVTADVDGIVIKKTAIVDHAAFAARDFKIGESIVKESPVMILPKLRKDTKLFTAIDDITAKHQFQEGLLYPLIYLLQASDVVREKVMNFFAPDLESSEGADKLHWERYHSICTEVCNEIEEFKSYDPKELVQFLLILRTNAHSTGDGTGASCLYEVGSKITHSCSPNCMGLVDKFTLEYRAIRDIKEGDLLTFSYISGFDLWKSTPLRRSLMKEQRFFMCVCARCVGPDYTRWMKCPECGWDETLYHMPGQTSFVDNPGEPTDTPWKCHNEKCGKEWKDDDFPLKEEHRLYATVINTYYVYNQGTQDRVHARQTYNECLAILGRYHFLTALMTYTLLALHHSSIQSKHAEPFPAQDVIDWCQALMRWFKKCMQGSMPEAIHAHFVAQTCEMHGMRELATQYYAQALPCLRVHWAPHHPNIHYMEEMVISANRPDWIKEAQLNESVVRKRWHQKLQAAQPRKEAEPSLQIKVNLPGNGTAETHGKKNKKKKGKKK
eukprot:TRINITY_DN63908_c0_g1_i1.p1 TRINITY_DN63908_c0_g1~~TRINITY_DN63908_c0_g1_i1.p1  ORF type:complete len:519 (-),score=52.72 TRINITY_DN63908_c0_g1_i1:1245-2801(-)